MGKKKKRGGLPQREKIFSLFPLFFEEGEGRKRYTVYLFLLS